MKYDYLIVGSGLFGATFAYKAHQADKTRLVIDKRPHLGGNVYCEPISLPTGERQQVGEPCSGTDGRWPKGKAMGRSEAVIFGSRLAEYKYYDMAPIIEKLLHTDFVF